MKHVLRAVAAAGLSVLLTLLLGATCVLPASAQTAEVPQEQTGASSDEVSKQELKQQAKEERIRAYLERKEERRLAREARGAGDTSVSSSAAPRRVASPPATQRTAAQKPNRKSRSPRSTLPRNLVRAQENVRRTALGQDPTVRSYLDLIEQQLAAPEQLAAFGNFLAQNGMGRDGLQYYSVALHLEPNDPVLWINAGTLHRQLNDVSTAAASFRKALELNPNHSVAHYNLGAIFDEQGKYEEAVREYKIALTIDPMLGDPATNPQAANNERLLAVKLMLYQESSGALGLPLIDVTPADPNATSGSDGP